MDAELYRTFLRQAQRGEHIRRLMAMEEWKSVEELIGKMIEDSDTVKGVKTDKEWMKRQERVDILEELLGQFSSLAEESKSAMAELTEEEDTLEP